jgi:hypothetical protein
MATLGRGARMHDDGTQPIQLAGLRAGGGGGGQVGVEVVQQLLAALGGCRCVSGGALRLAMHRDR